MASVKTPAWIQLWFLVSSLVVYWDAGYCLLRPHSMEGGSLNYLWTPYNLYAKIDYVYGLPALHSNDGWTSAQAFMNVVESTMNLLYLYMVRNPGKYNASRVQLLGFTAIVLTLNKTILYGLNEVFSGMKHTGHNDWPTFLGLWIVPNCTWIVVPSVIFFKLGAQLCRELGASSLKKSA
ncbi:hypothetical protein BC940DRAFT_311486 [Gongronella butleri]|nr:hypothetical protein BC940DRAFT_311486 [Gongronella butleri]